MSKRVRMDDNQGWWDKHQAEYPFHREEDTTGERVHFTPEDWWGYRERFGGDFIRVPIPERNVVLWGFVSEAGAAAFEAEFPQVKVVG